MAKLKQVVVLLALLIVGFGLGRQSLQPARPEAIVSSQAILDKIQTQQFLVTRTLYLDEAVTVTVTDPTGWQGFFLGDELQARALVRLDVGVDWQGISADSIKVDSAAKTINLKLPETSILDASLSGDLGIKNKRGIWVNLRELFKADSGEDYNRAADELLAQASVAAMANPDIFQQARDASLDLVKLIVTSLDPAYQVNLSEAESEFN